MMSSDNFVSKLGCRGPQFLLVGRKRYSFRSSEFFTFLSDRPLQLPPGETGFTSEFTCQPQLRYSGWSERNVKISMERREYSVRCRVGIWSLPKSLLMLQKGSNIAQNDPEKILLTIHDVLRRFVKNGTPKGGRRVYRAFQNPYFCSKKTQIRLKMIHARYS